MSSLDQPQQILSQHSGAIGRSQWEGFPKSLVADLIQSSLAGEWRRYSMIILVLPDECTDGPHLTPELGKFGRLRYSRTTHPKGLQLPDLLAVFPSDLLQTPIKGLTAEGRV